MPATLNLIMQMCLWGLKGQDALVNVTMVKKILYDLIMTFWSRL